MDIRLVRGMGYIPDVPSIKDFTVETPSIAALFQTGNQTAERVITSQTRAGRGGLATATAVEAPAIATNVDLRTYFSPIENQENLGACTANAAVALVEYFEKRAFNKFLNASRLFVYKTTRNLLGWTGDTGAYIRTTMGSLALFGVPPEQFWPYAIDKFDVEPPAFCYAFGSHFQALQYFRLDPNGAAPTTVLNNVKTLLTAGFPCMFGFPVYDEFMNPVNAKVPFPSPSSHLFGGHAIVAAGFDDDITIGGDKGAVLIRNSWGNTWGDHGYAWLSYKYFTEGLAVDCWSLLKAEWVNTGQFGVVPLTRQ